MSTTRTRSTVRAAVAGLLLVSPLAMAACGGDDAADDSKATTTTAAPAKQEKLEVTDVWARTAKAGGNGAVYMTIIAGAEDDALTSATVPADLADKVELHETVAASGGTDTTAMGSDTPTTAMHSETTTTAMHAETTEPMGGSGTPTTMGGGGMMTMHQVEKIPVKGGASVQLKPGGLHVMLFGLKKDLTVGETVPVTLTFEKAGEVKVTAEVREP